MHRLRKIYRPWVCMTRTTYMTIVNVQNQSDGQVCVAKKAQAKNLLCVYGWNIREQIPQYLCYTIYGHLYLWHTSLMCVCVCLQRTGWLARHLLAITLTALKLNVDIYIYETLHVAQNARHCWAKRHMLGLQRLESGSAQYISYSHFIAPSSILRCGTSPTFWGEQRYRHRYVPDQSVHHPTMHFLVLRNKPNKAYSVDKNYSHGGWEPKARSRSHTIDRKSRSCLYVCIYVYLYIYIYIYIYICFSQISREWEHLVHTRVASLVDR